MTPLDKETWLKLAEAYVKDFSYLDKLDNVKRQLAEEHGIEKDFLGLDYFGGNLFNEVSTLLGDDFSYWYFDCERDFKRYNKNTTYPDGSHPKVKNLADLWEETCKQENE